MSLTITVTITPNASRYRWKMSNDNLIKCYVTSPAVNGKANAEFVKKLADLLAISSRLIRIDSGLTTRTKRIVINATISFEQFLQAVGLTNNATDQLTFLSKK